MEFVNRVKVGVIAVVLELATVSYAWMNYAKLVQTSIYVLNAFQEQVSMNINNATVNWIIILTQWKRIDA